MTLRTSGQTIDFIEKIFGPGKLSNGGLNISVVCPKCLDEKPHGYTKKKLVIRTDNFLSHCWVCNTKSRSLVPWLHKWYPSYLKEYLEIFHEEDNLVRCQLLDIDPTTLEESKLTLPQGFRLLATTNTESESRQARRYLAKRGITSEQELWYWKFGISNEDIHTENRIIIPSFDAAGKLNYWTARSWRSGASPKYTNPPTHREGIIFNEINIDWTQPLTIVEGPFDLLKCNENATCLLGSTLSPDYLLFRKIVENDTPVVLALDADAVDKTNKLAKLLSEYEVDVSIINVPEKYGDVGAMSKTTFRSMYTNEQVKYTRDSSLLNRIKTFLG